MTVDATDPPFVDEHRITIAAPREAVWTALRRYVDGSLGVSERHPLGWLLGAQPRSGFAVADEVVGQRVMLAGRHRFSRYQLVFSLADAPNGQTALSARTNAAFPGLPGRIYRALVIGSRGHVVAVRRMLDAVRRLALG